MRLVRVGGRDVCDWLGLGSETYVPGQLTLSLTKARRKMYMICTVEAVRKPIDGVVGTW